jgi:hypothetical protein
MNKPELPKTIYFNGVPWSVVQEPFPEEESTATDWGRVDYSALKITIFHTAPTLDQEVSLHEVLHALFFTHGMNQCFKNDKKEENFILLFAPFFWRFMRDNPDLVEYWMADL